MFYHLYFERCNDDIHLNCHREALSTVTLTLCSTLQSPEQVVKIVIFRLHSVPPVKSESLRAETVSA